VGVLGAGRSGLRGRPDPPRHARRGRRDRPRDVDDDVRVHTIGETAALGICGSGLLDLVAACSMPA
jgi:hypothetical protein